MKEKKKRVSKKVKATEPFIFVPTPQPEIPVVLDALRRLYIIYRDQRLMAPIIKKYVPVDEKVLWGMVTYDEVIRSYANEEYNTLETYRQEMRNSGIMSQGRISKELLDIVKDRVC